MRIGSTSDDPFESHRPGTKLLARSLAEEVQAWWLLEAGAALRREASIDDFDLQVLAIHHGGASTREVAGSLGMTPEKVRRRLRSITAKLRSVDRRAAGQRAAEYGLI